MKKVLMIAIVALLTGCSKTDNSATPNNGSLGTSSNSPMSYTQDGTPVNNDTIGITASWSKQTWKQVTGPVVFIKTSMGEQMEIATGKGLGLVVIGESVRVGTYQLGMFKNLKSFHNPDSTYLEFSNCGKLLTDIYNPLKDAETDSINKGTIIIASLDNGRVKGTFNFKAYNKSTGKYYNFTNGQFNMKYTKSF